VSLPARQQLPSDAHSLWIRDFPPEGSQRALKHDLVKQVKRLVEATALLDQGNVELADLRELIAAAKQLADRTGQLPSLRALGGPALADGDDSALVERSPFMGRSNPLAPPLHLEADGDLTRGWAVWTDAYEGPPGRVHGGFVAAAFDDLMGYAQIASGSAGYTGTLSVTMRQPTPLNRRIDYAAGVSRHEGRKIFVWGTATCGDDLLAESEIVFIEPRRE
jgi:acyl-coenzyme A thioesterase PaaI-like protein